MRIYVNYVWHRSYFNEGNGYQILDCEEKSKKVVTQAIRDWVKSWKGRGYVLVLAITTAYADDLKYCDIAQKKFNFNN